MYIHVHDVDRCTRFIYSVVTTWHTRALDMYTHPSPSQSEHVYTELQREDESEKGKHTAIFAVHQTVSTKHSFVVLSLQWYSVYSSHRLVWLLVVPVPVILRHLPVMVTSCGMVREEEEEKEGKREEERWEGKERREGSRLRLRGDRVVEIKQSLNGRFARPKHPLSVCVLYTVQWLSGYSPAISNWL